MLTIAGLGNVVWSSCLHQEPEKEDTNGRFRSLQPSPEKEQKAAQLFFPVLVFQGYNLLAFLQRDNEISLI